ncbi:hypothetical protein Hanom_Chr01g00088671 [Helianthus anomalus]
MLTLIKCKTSTWCNNYVKHFIEHLVCQCPTVSNFVREQLHKSRKKDIIPNQG